ncbi:MAG: hypothetical protein COV65_00285 [Nitrosopumilales archaeon CG11_big_fil_rev_8_21_14_0_20_33_24]|nr:MAG: hypothetical protein COV65_00285 [Nitrosopumilales archaeon CG11_big_fil_rev_8_21_14_0_20_33_24]
MQQRKNLDLESPFREICRQDAEQIFTNEIQPQNNIDLSWLVGKNISSRYVLVYDYQGKTLGFLTFIDKGTHFHLDLVENNRKHKETTIHKPGYQLIKKLEDLSLTFGYPKITLYSTDSRLSYYQDVHEYTVTGARRSDPHYDFLTPMEKILT